MESILSQLADSSVDIHALECAYKLLIRILSNIVQASRRGDPNIAKFKWVKANEGSALVKTVLNVHPLFRQLLEVLGFRYTVGRPPYVADGRSQEYFVLEDGADVDEVAVNASVLEAVVQSLRSEEPPTPLAQQPESSAPSGRASTVQSGGSQSVSPPPSRNSESGRGNDVGGDDLVALREEQRRRYERQAGRGVSNAQQSSGQNADGGDGDDSSSSWFWRKFGWGSNNNDDSNQSGGSSSSRRPPRNNRMMTLRDLPKPQRRG